MKHPAAATADATGPDQPQPKRVQRVLQFHTGRLQYEINMLQFHTGEVSV